MQAHSVEVQGCAQFCQGVGRVRVEEAVIVHVQRERQAILKEGAGQDVVVARQHFALIKPRADHHARAVVNDVDEMPLRFTARHESMGRGVHLPQLTDALALPAADAGPLARWREGREGRAQPLARAQRRTLERLVSNRRRRCSSLATRL